MFSTSRQIGRADFADDCVTQETLANLHLAIGLNQEHMSHEETYVRPALESKLPGNTDRFLEDHEEYDGLSVEIEQLAARIRNANGAERVELGVEVHERFNA